MEFIYEILTAFLGFIDINLIITLILKWNCNIFDDIEVHKVT